jgi:hypothetical protein
MPKHETPLEPDPRLENPDQYFAERYGDVTVKYGDHTLPLRTALEFENLARTPEDIQSDPKERRANVFISMLREAEALDPEDDITYPERP